MSVLHQKYTYAYLVGMGIEKWRLKKPEGIKMVEISEIMIEICLDLHIDNFRGPHQ